jgi:hypothetical protein
MLFLWFLSLLLLRQMLCYAHLFAFASLSMLAGAPVIDKMLIWFLLLAVAS